VIGPAPLVVALWIGPPPPPPDVEDDPEAPPAQADPPPTDAEPPAPPAASRQAPAEDVARDERGDPIIPHGDLSNPEAELEYADAATADPELEYAAQANDDAPPIERDERFTRPVPPDEALDREATATDDLFRGRKPSPQRFALELKFGPYVPDVDRGYGGDGDGPYKTVFGETDANGNVIDDPRPGLFSVLGFEWQFDHLGGPFLLGTTVGYFRDTADAIVADPAPDGPIRSSADQTGFNVVPLSLLLGYRFELLADRFRVPIVPYARGGISYGIWWSTDGNGDVSENSEGDRARGGSVGWEANFGGMLRLDFIERGASNDLDRATGINHTYLFGEYRLSRLDGFGQGRRMSVGDDTWLLGLAIEF
jgi:hypothetical protein